MPATKHRCKCSIGGASESPPAGMTAANLFGKKQCMTYRLHRIEPVQRSVRKVVVEQIDAAIDEIEGPNTRTATRPFIKCASIASTTGIICAGCATSGR